MGGDEAGEGLGALGTEAEPRKDAVPEPPPGIADPARGDHRAKAAEIGRCCWSIPVCGIPAAVATGRAERSRARAIMVVIVARQRTRKAMEASRVFVTESRMHSA